MNTSVKDHIDIDDWDTKDQEALHKKPEFAGLCDQYRPLVLGMAKLYSKYLDFVCDDLIQEGYAALLEAYTSYNESHPGKQGFPGWAKMMVTNGMRRYVYANSHICKLPTSNEAIKMFWWLPRHLDGVDGLAQKRVEAIAREYRVQVRDVSDAQSILKGSLEFSEEINNTDMHESDLSTLEIDCSRLCENLDGLKKKVFNTLLANPDSSNKLVAQCCDCSAERVRQIKTELASSLSGSRL